MKTDKMACFNCGWCCKRTTCFLGASLGGPLRGKCQFLVKKDEKFYCKIILEEKVHKKRKSYLRQILSGKGCTHKFGPHPQALLKLLIENGFKVGTDQWSYAKRETIKELKRFMQESADPSSIKSVLLEFEDFCTRCEKEIPQILVN